MLSRLIGIAALIGIVTQATDVGAEQMSYFTDLVQSILVQSEVNNINKRIYTDLVIPNGMELPYRSDDEWSEYIRRYMRSNALGRDTADDLWGHRYTVADRYDLPGLGTEGFEVRSPGPDGAYETDDDITAVRSLE